MPVAGFTADGKANAQVSINITGLTETNNVTIDGEYDDVPEDG
jgi:hypothetical protein